MKFGLNVQGHVMPLAEQLQKKFHVMKNAYQDALVQKVLSVTMMALVSQLLIVLAHTMK